MSSVHKEQKECLLSIIVPVYNAEVYLQKCIDSILQQTFTGFELLLIDDGSTDRSGMICDYYAGKDKRIEVYHTENRGSVAAREIGIVHSKGRYIGFVDSDDYVERTLFEVLVKNIIESDADFVHIGYIEENGEVSKEVFGFEDGLFSLKGSEDRERFLIEYVLHTETGRSITYSIWSKLFKKELIKKCFSQLPDEQQLGEDLLCLCLCILESKRILLRRCALYHYVVRKKSLAHMQEVEFVIKDMKLNYHIVKVLQNYNEILYIKLMEHICYYVKKKFLDMIETFHANEICMPRFYLKNVNIIRGKKIAIYGAGGVGRDYYTQFSKYKDIEITAWFDSNWQNYKYDYADVAGVDAISDYSFDKIIIAVKEEITAKEIKSVLLEYGVSKDKIMWTKPESVLEDSMLLSAELSREDNL